MSDTQDQPEARPDVAAEYVVGVLNGAERREAERRMREDGAFASSVVWWENRLAPLISEIRSVEASSVVWDRISADIDRIARVSATYRARSEQSTKKKSKGLGGVSPIWRTLAGASSLLAVGALAALAILVPPQEFGPGTPGDQTTLAARLASDAGETIFTVVVDLESRTATLVPVDGISDQDRVPELWLLEQQATEPRSLGLIQAGEPLTLQLQEIGENAIGGTVEISLEPPGGSPTGLPTGPVVAIGSLDRI
ncbi:anti-sigma factor [Fulvimarina sp. MAC8]|uniref:anti-sigma factor n=1 Tax=Fulvimarina sp. MAC8 TaxID=3162874 RepID=UPI0032F05E98